MPHKRIASFGPFTMDLDRDELRRDGRSIPLEPLPARVLTTLLERAGRVVLRDELFETCWGEESHRPQRALNTAIRQVRRALDDSAGDCRFLETIPRRGYRLTVSVNVHEGGKGAMRGSSSKRRPRSYGRRVVLGGAAVVAIAAGAFATVSARDQPVRVAVLPFEVRSDIPNAEVVSSLWLEDVTAALSRPRADRLHVIAPSSSLRYRHPGPERENAAADLDVAFIVEGNVRSAGDGLEVVTRLVRTRDLVEMWSETYPVNDALSAGHVPGTIARRVVTTLLSDRDDPGDWYREPTEAARLPFYMGRHLLARQDWDGRIQSIPYFERAVAADPTYAPAQAMLAEALLLTGRLARADTVVRRARALNPDLPIGHLVWGLVQAIRYRDQRRAAEHLREAIDLAPDDTKAMQALAFHLLARGDTNAALSWMHRAARLDPVSAAVQGDLGYFYYWAGHYSDATLWCRRAHTLDPLRAWPLWCLYDTARASGDLATALETAAKLLGRAPPGADPIATLDSARLAAARLAVADDLPAQYPLALALADAGRLEEAAQTLLKAAAEPTLGILTLGIEPRLRPLRNSPLYRIVLDSLGLTP